MDRRDRPLFAVLLGLLLVTSCSSHPVDQNTVNATSESEIDDPSGTPAVTEPGTEYAGRMEQLAKAMGIQNPPSVEPVRGVTNREKPQVMADCLTSAGFPTEVGADGRSWTTELSEGQAEAHRLAEYTCMGQYPLLAEFAGEFSDDQLRVHYAWLRDEVIPCMQKLGYPTPEVPSWEVVRSQYVEQGQLWFPDTELNPETLADAMSDIMANCEVFPPDDLLYGTN